MTKADLILRLMEAQADPQHCFMNEKDKRNEALIFDALAWLLAAETPATSPQVGAEQKDGK